MRIGLVDVDAESRGKVTFPNLALMKISAWHKARGDTVEWYQPLLSGHMDRVYLARVFSDAYTRDYIYPIDADEVIRGGSGYAIKLVNGLQVYDKSLDPPLKNQIEHIFPDYGLYGISDTAYGFITRGCPRGCDFCHVAKMQGRCTHRVADLSEFWNGQKNIVLLDPNITACRDAIEIFNQLADTGSYVDFSQGLDARLLSLEKIEALNHVKVKSVHFAWDRPEQNLRPHLQRIREHYQKCRRDCCLVYVLTNFRSTFEQDMERVQFIRQMGMQPYVMVYNKFSASKDVRDLQRWVNMPALFWKYPTLEEYRRCNHMDKSKKSTAERVNEESERDGILQGLFSE